MWKAAERLRMSKVQREQLESWIASPTTEQRVVHRSRIVLLAAEGKANHGIAKEVGTSRPTVLLWRNRFEQEGPEGLLRDRPRGSGKPPLPEEKIEAVVEATLHTKPKGATHWSVRSMAKAQGISPAAVQRIWAAHGLKPHLVRTFKLSRDPHFLEKLRDVVGLYLNPPEHGLVLCFDEKSQIQALDRTQPGLPLKKGRAGTQTHDYKRNGTTSLFVALNLLDGTVIGECMPRHRHQEFLRFLKRLDRDTPPDLQLHLILDNYQTHKHPKVQSWLERHPRFHLHFIPTSSSWLNLVERWLRELTGKAIRRGAFPSVSSLEAAIYDYIDHNNQEPKPLIWTATVDQILAKVSRGKAKLETLH
jgi:transposase